MKELGKINPKKQALSQALEAAKFQPSETDTLSLTEQRNNLLRYSVSVSNERLAVFSEMHYPNGWQAYLNDNPIPHYKVNYLLRGVVVPPGNHELVFRFEPQVVRKGTWVMASGWLLFFIMLGLIIRKPKIVA